MRNTCKTVAELGVSREDLHPYSRTNLFKAPSATAYKYGRTTRWAKYSRVPTNAESLKLALQDGVVEFGMVCTESFMGDPTGKF